MLKSGVKVQLNFAKSTACDASYCEVLAFPSIYELSVCGDLHYNSNTNLCNYHSSHCVMLQFSPNQISV